MSLFGLLTEHKNELTLGTPRDKHEKKMMQEVNEEIQKVSGKSGITVKVGAYTFHHIIGMNSNFPGDPKADVSLVSVAGGKAAEVAYLSFKVAGGAQSFQQYSGLTEGAGLTIANDKLVQQFLLDAGKHIRSFNKGKDVAKQGTPAVYSFVPNTVPGHKLVQRAVFGPDYQTISIATTGGHKENVHVIAQGDPSLVKSTQGGYELTFSEHCFSNNVSIGWAFKKADDYRAVLAGTFRNGRGFTVKGKRFMNFRVGLYPFKLVGTRTGAVEV